MPFFQANRAGSEPVQLGTVVHRAHQPVNFQIQRVKALAYNLTEDQNIN